MIAALALLLLAADPFLGLSVREIPGGHVVVSRIMPGPLDGVMLSSTMYDIARPDLLVAVNGEAVTAESFESMIDAMAPGETVRLEYRRSRQRGGTIPQALDHEDEVRVIEVVLGDRDEWTGTIGRGRRVQRRIELTGPAVLEELASTLEAHDMDGPVTALCDVIAGWPDRDDDAFLLSRVEAAFRDPFRMPELGDLVTAPMRVVASNPYATLRAVITETTDAPGPSPYSAMDWRHVARTPVETELLEAVYWAQMDLRVGLGTRFGDAAFAEQCLALLRVPRETFYIQGGDAHAHIEVIRSSLDVQFGQFDSALGRLVGATEVDVESLGGVEPMAVPDELAVAIEGEILSASFADPAGWVVIGGDGPNRYDMSRIAAVIDPGGDDVYETTTLRLGPGLIIDLAGNDTYLGGEAGGPASAILGVSIIDDRAGDDRYDGRLLATGAAIYGVSIVLDRGGNDVYSGSTWSVGAACYGAGIVVDLGRGNDTYLGDYLCEGVGGPRAIGAIIDDGGRDLYRANGPTPSAYGTPAVYQSFSQGIGFGFRSYAAGGVGVLCDLGGDDRYEAGEFAQGGAYYYGLGILRDYGGRDLYYGNRYSQGFGVHQAAGMLIDDAGDDTYWSMTAASQGAAWDVGVGLLLDRAGNDTYQCDGLGQGGAAHQAIAMLVDLAGRDRYIAGGGAVQGRSGNDDYHYHETGVHSFSLLLDAGGEVDLYSTGRPNDAVTVTGEANDGDPASSSLHGLIIDR